MARKWPSNGYGAQVAPATRKTAWCRGRSLVQQSMRGYMRYNKGDQARILV